MEMPITALGSEPIYELSSQAGGEQSLARKQQADTAFTHGGLHAPQCAEFKLVPRSTGANATPVGN